MQYRNLGSSGLKVSAIGLGTNQFGGKVSFKSSADIIDAAIDAGVNFLDSANIYQKGRSEEAIGKAIQGKRDRVLIASKVFHPVEPRGPNDRGSSRNHIMQAVEASLKRLNTDYLDLYQLHSWDESTPLEESMQTLDDLVRAGKVRYIGASNFTAWQLSQANAVAGENGWTSFVSIQPHYHLLERNIEAELIPACKYLNIGILPYFPLAGGFLTGKYKEGKAAPKGTRGEESPYVQKYFTKENFKVIYLLSKLAKDSGHSLNELAHAWLLAQPQISSVISGATKVEHVLENISADAWQLTTKENDQIGTILDGDNKK
jgi:aryl-alcohol dehydrogenase-like predicted oxidoreductase